MITHVSPINLLSCSKEKFYLKIPNGKQFSLKSNQNASTVCEWVIYSKPLLSVKESSLV